MPTDCSSSSSADFGCSLADFVSKYLSPPTVAIVATVLFSLWSPIGLGSLGPGLSIVFSFLLFAFFPFLPVIYFYKKKTVDLYVSNREERLPFLLYALASYLSAAILFFFTDTTILFLLALGYVSVTAVLIIVNQFSKVSIHCAGVTGPIFALVFVFGIEIIPISVIIILVCWSRIKLKNHTPTQTLAGTLIALTIGLIEYNLLYPIR
ncbi:MAG: phosphatase PAP2 family protein [Candidatus Bathyarchaeota archaeon]|nr:MAG: phosphatase PAP2 family protein [Candidatus Bathyarchaeota archaeon]